MTAHVVTLRRTLVVRLPERARGYLYVCAGAALAATGASVVVPLLHARWADFGVILAAGAVAQLFATHTSGNQVFHTGLAFTVAAALILPPELVVLVAVGQHVPEWIRQRYPWFIQTFNTANVVLSGLAAWAVKDVLGRAGWHLMGSAAVSSVAVAAAAVTAYIAVNHGLLARMLWLARGHDASASGLFSLDGLVTDGAVASVGIGVAFALLHEPALVVTAILPLLLIQRAVAVPTLRQQAFTDHKTELLNSRGIDQAARSEFARARRAGGTLSMLICDIDDLRGINNRYGHLQGDAALAAVGDAFRAVLRPYDLCARFGGDEFLVVLPETTQDAAVTVAERIQRELESHPVETHLGTFHVSLSVGTASLHDDDTRIGNLIERADDAMYEAKSAGRASFLTVG
jgi:diguanylate cyclase (GGDEF)-like protein